MNVIKNVTILHLSALVPFDCPLRCISLIDICDPCDSSTNWAIQTTNFAQWAQTIYKNFGLGTDQTFPTPPHSTHTPYSAKRVTAACRLYATPGLARYQIARCR